MRSRPASFADHYNQARQFYLSQTPLERQHLAAALVFELSKVETRAIRSRVVAHLLNIDDKLAMNVAEGLRLEALPAPATRVVAPRADLPASPSLSIMRTHPRTFGGRTLGALVTDGVDELSAAARDRVQRRWRNGGAHSCGDRRCEDRGWCVAGGQADARDRAFGAVRCRGDRGRAAGEEGGIAASSLAASFVADAFARTANSSPTRATPGRCSNALAGAPLDGGCRQVETAMAAASFAAQCAQLRFWAREPVQGL